MAMMQGEVIDYLSRCDSQAMHDRSQSGGLLSLRPIAGVTQTLFMSHLLTDPDCGSTIGTC